MKGESKLQLSVEDTKQAMQDWVDKHLVDKPIVETVAQVGDPNSRSQYVPTAIAVEMRLTPRPVPQSPDL